MTKEKTPRAYAAGIASRSGVFGQWTLARVTLPDRSFTAMWELIMR